MTGAAGWVYDFDMTRKDYERLADAFGHATIHATATERRGVTIAQGLVEDQLAADNGRFNRDRFRARVDAITATAKGGR